MKSDRPLDYAVFQLSPKRSRCELFVSSDGNTEKLASGLVKPFVTHLKVAEEQFALAVQSIKLEADKRGNAESWFTKGTLERFVRFVSTPEVLELVNTFDAEMSQLEAARNIYSQGTGDQLSGSLGGDGMGSLAAADATKKELLRAIDVRLLALKQELVTACTRAAAAGFNSESVSELQLFSDQFGARRLNEACGKFLSLCQKRPDLHNSSNAGIDDRALRSSYGSDMSIDDSPEHLPRSHIHHQIKHPVAESGASTCQQPKMSSFLTGCSVSKSTCEEKKEEDTSATESSVQTSQQASRRLSVQDRINLFENKQKLGSGPGSGSGSGSGNGGKPVVGKSIELRRQSSSGSGITAAAAVDKAVLRRWSGASDMSIDLGNDRKDMESPLCTPSSSSSTSHLKSGAFSGVAENNGQKDQPDSQAAGEAQARSFADGSNSVSFLNQEFPRNQFKSPADRAEQVFSTDKGLSKERVNVLSGVQEHGGFKDHLVSDAQFTGLSGRAEVVGQKNQGAPQQVPPSMFSSKAEEVHQSRFRSPTKTMVRSVAPEFHSQSHTGLPEGGGGKEVLEGSLTRHKSAESFGEEAENKPGRRGLTSSEKSGNFANKVEDSGEQRIMLQRRSSGSEQGKKSQGRREDINNVSGNSKLAHPAKIVSESRETVGSMSTTALEQVQRERQVKGNQELNDELKIKANELEKLFAEHKLRVPGDQPISNRRTKPTDVQMEQVESSQSRKPVAEAAPSHLHSELPVPEPTGSSSTVAKLNPGRKLVDNQNYGDAHKHNFSELDFSDDYRGKFYERYMQKRDAKLREEWSSKGAEKELKMKAMHDSLERSRSELKAKFAASAERQDSVLNARKRAEKLRSFNNRSALKREQQPIDSVESQEDEYLSSELSEQKLYGQDRLVREVSPGDGASRSTQPRMLTPNKYSSSLTPRASAVPASRSSIKASNSGPGRRKGQLENPLVQSVPNFSDLRKENTKPASGGSKTAARSQVRNYARSRSTTEETPLVKDEKPRRSHSLKKSAASPVEFKDLSSLSSDGVVLTPLKFDKEQTEQSFENKILKTVESKPFLRKGNGIGPGSGAGIAKLRASMASEALIDEEEASELQFEQEDYVDVVNEEGEEEFDTSMAEDSAIMDDEKERLSQEYDKLGNSESENGDVRSASQVNPASVAEMPSALPLAFHTVGPVQDSPGESPVSWNSRTHHSFSYPHESSDVDVSADSPMGSPASWNSHSLNQTEADAARMRKKWGSAHKPVIVVNSSQNQSRKDVTKGFKRLLKFGRKSRGADTMVDWVSATTSEGDDDTEDGRDPANRLSEDLRKSRMGFSQGHPSEYVFNESDLFNEHVQGIHSSIPAPPSNFKLREDHLSGSSLKAPRSFFSLSTFRSKGSDSKPR